MWVSGVALLTDSPPQVGSLFAWPRRRLSAQPHTGNTCLADPLPDTCNYRSVSKSLRKKLHLHAVRALSRTLLVIEYLMTNSVALEPKGSSRHAQEPVTGPYPEPDESTPYL
jgi:hypothetical protein